MHRLWAGVALVAVQALAAPFHAPMAAQTPTTDRPPSPHASSNYPGESFIIEKHYTTARFENNGKGERDLAVRIRVQDSAAVQQFSELVFPFDSAHEQMEVRSFRVIKRDGTVINVPSGAVSESVAAVARDFSAYAERKEKHISLADLQAGDTLEYDIATRLVAPIAPGEFWLEYIFPDDAIVLDERLEINLPRLPRSILKAPGFPYATDAGSTPGRTIYRWKRSNLTRRTPSDEQKNSSEARPRPPDVQLTTFTDWDAVAHWYASLSQDRVQLAPEIRAKTEEVLRGRSGELEKIEALYDYVSRSIRTVRLPSGPESYQPRLPVDVLRDQYGTPLDKHTLLTAMLAVAGLPVSTVLTSALRDLDPALPSPTQLDYVITAVRQTTGLLWMDSAAEVAPFRFLSASLRKKSALVFSRNGTGQILETPADPPFLSEQNVEVEGFVSELGKLTAKVRYSLRGDNEFVLRLAFHRTPEAQWKQLGQTVLTVDGVQGDVTSVKPSDPLDTRMPFSLEIQYTKSNFFDWLDKTPRIAMPLLTIGMPDPPENKTQPIALGSPLNVVTHLMLTLPAAFTARAPVAISVARDYADFTSNYHFGDHALTADRTLRFKLHEISGSRVDDYAAFARAVQGDQAQRLSLENSLAGGPAIPSSAGPGELEEAAEAALGSSNARSAVPLFRRVVQLQPEHASAWNDLGLAYLRLGQLEEAADAFGKQININPSSEHVYDYLGLTLEQQGKFDEAAGAFRKQIERDPLDSIAHGALGKVFLAQEKFTEALPELDKAAALAPDNAQLQVSLGQAYLNLGQSDSALAAFEKAASISPTPRLWNEAALILADQKVALDKAREFAQSALSATSAHLTKIDLSHLTSGDLSEVAGIPHCWDTLGWVYFQRGDLRLAERYIRAAWLLGEDGIAGSHLAQIYEHLGRKEQAIQMYSAALAAPLADSNARARLILLLGGNATINNRTDRAKADLANLRKFSAGKFLGKDGQADFWVLLSPGEKKPQVDDVRFIYGEQALRPLAERLRSFDYGPVFPDTSAIQVVRRGTLTCASASGECQFILRLPQDVPNAN